MEDVKKEKRIIDRPSGDVIRTTLDMTVVLNNRLEKACEELNMSKRQIVEYALFAWLNKRDKEMQK
jgi:hypothetical protein